MCSFTFQSICVSYKCNFTFFVFSIYIILHYAVSPFIQLALNQWLSQGFSELIKTKPKPSKKTQRSQTTAARGARGNKSKYIELKKINPKKPRTQKSWKKIQICVHDPPPPLHHHPVGVFPSSPCLAVLWRQRGSAGHVTPAPAPSWCPCPCPAPRCPRTPDMHTHMHLCQWGTYFCQWRTFLTVTCSFVSVTYTSTSVCHTFVSLTHTCTHTHTHTHTYTSVSDTHICVSDTYISVSDTLISVSDTHLCQWHIHLG